MTQESRPEEPAGPLKPLIIVMHGLHPHGGMERSNLELAKRLLKHRPVACLVADRDVAHIPGGVEVHRLWLPIRRPILLKALWYHLASLPALARLRRRRPASLLTAGTCSIAADLIQVHFCYHAWREAKRVYKLREPRLVSRWYQALLISFNCFLERRLYKPDKKFIAVSESVARDLRRFFGAKNVEVIRHGIDASSFFPARAAEKQVVRQELGLLRDAFVVLFVGAFERKGLDTALAAFAQAGVPDSFFIAVGRSAAGGASFSQAAERLGITGRVRFFPPAREIAHYYAAADCFLFPTRYEPFGLVITEAMAAGLPVITTACAGAAELIEHGKSGFVVEDPADTARFAEHIKALAQNPALAKELAVAGRAAIEQRSWDIVAAEYEKVLYRD